MAYDRMTIALVHNPNRTYDLAVGLYTQGERCFYREYQMEISSYGEAYWYASQKAAEYQRTIRFHGLEIEIACEIKPVESQCPAAEKFSQSILAA
jgi:hypothetical protein